MYKIEYSNENNNIYIELSGEMPQEEKDNYIKDVKKTIDSTKTGFTVVVNIYNSSIENALNGNEFQPVRDYAKTKGFKEVVYGVGESNYEYYQEHLLNQIDNVFRTVEEAKEYLGI